MDDILGNLRKAVLEYDKEAVESWARKALGQGIDPVAAFAVLTAAIKHVGDGFGIGELFLPDLVGAADAMSVASPILEEEMVRRGATRESSGVVVIGTVYGDIHTIGKDMVATLLRANGFIVHDIGVNVTAEEFVGAIKRHQPDILAMSALMTTTAAEQRKTIEIVKKEGMRDKVKIMVGGGAITQEFANGIGADGYDATAPGAAKLATDLLGTQRRNA